MKKISLIVIFSMLLLSVSLVSAHEHDFGETKQLIDSGISCDELTNVQLEAIGEYYMEQMHPGEAHELMDEMMGGEGSDSLKQVHIQMAKRLYCNENIDGMTGGGMMGMMMGSGGMMNMMGGQNIQNGGMMQGISGNYYGSYNLFGWLFMILVITILVLTIIILINKLKGEGVNKHGR